MLSAIAQIYVDATPTFSQLQIVPWNLLAQLTWHEEWFGSP